MNFVLGWGDFFFSYALRNINGMTNTYLVKNIVLQIHLSAQTDFIYCKHVLRKDALADLAFCDSMLTYHFHHICFDTDKMSLLLLFSLEVWNKVFSTKKYRACL